MKKKFLIVILCMILITSITACNKSSSNINQNSKPETKEEYISLETMKSIPKFKCKDINGNEVTNDIFKDKKLTLVTFWGTW